MINLLIKGEWVLLGVLVAALLGKFCIHLLTGYTCHKKVPCCGGSKIKRRVDFELPNIVGMIVFGCIARNIM